MRHSGAQGASLRGALGEPALVKATAQHSKPRPQTQRVLSPPERYASTVAAAVNRPERNTSSSSNAFTVGIYMEDKARLTCPPV